MTACQDLRFFEVPLELVTINCITITIRKHGTWSISMKTNKVRLQLLKDMGFQPKGILDIGAHIGKWSIMANMVFPETPIFMVEGNRENSNQIDESLNTIQQSSPQSSRSITLLSDIEKVVTYYTPKHGSTSGSSIYRENTIHYSDQNTITEERSTQTLDQLVKDSGTTYDLIKLDVQGSEYDIIKGGGDTIAKARFILLEAQLIEYNNNAPLAHELINALSEYEFIIFDIYELHYLPDGRLNEIDILFARKDDPFLKLSTNHSFENNEDKRINYDICIAKHPPKRSFIRKLINK